VLKGVVLRYRGLFLSVTLLAVTAILYILLNYNLLQRLHAEHRYATTVEGVFRSATKVSANTSKTIANLNAINVGGVVSLTNGDQQQIPSLSEFLGTPNTLMDQAVEALKNRQWTVLNKTLTTLRQQIQDRRNSKNKLIETLQIAAILMVIVFYIVVIVPIFYRLYQSRETDTVVKKETEGILNTVSEGLFLLGLDHEIGIEQSSSLKGMFRSTRDIEGNFFDFINQYLTPNTVQVARDYLDLLFGDRVKEKLIEELNPLTEVEVNIARRDGSFERRYLNFSFKRVLEDGKLNHLLGSVTDITKQTELARLLQESKDEQEAQLDLLMGILQVDNKLLHLFLDNTEKSLEDINATLEDDGPTKQSNRAKLADIKRQVHRIKGDAAALGLHRFEFAAHAFEDELKKVELEQSQTLTGRDFLPAVTLLKELFVELRSMRALFDKFSSAISTTQSRGNSASSFETARPTTNGSTTGSSKMSGVVETDTRFHTMTNKIAQRIGKQVNLSVFGFDTNQLNDDFTTMAQSLATQLLRNSIVHGIESPETRVASGKSGFGNVLVNLSNTNDQAQLIVRDDGRGLDPKKILARAIELKLINRTKAKSLTPSQIIQLNRVSALRRTLTWMPVEELDWTWFMTLSERRAAR